MSSSIEQKNYQEKNERIIANICDNSIDVAPAYLKKFHWWLIDAVDIASMRNNEWVTDSAVFRLLYEKVANYNKQKKSFEICLLHFSFFNEWESSTEIPGSTFKFNSKNYACFFNNRSNNRFIIPLLHNNHYSFLHASKAQDGKRRIQIFDSLFGTSGGKIESKTVKKLVSCLDPSFADCTPYFVREGSILKQEDGQSCGIHLILNVEAILNDPPMNTTRLLSYYSEQTTISDSRRRLTEELLKISGKRTPQDFPKIVRQTNGTRRTECIDDQISTTLEEHKQTEAISSTPVDLALHALYGAKLHISNLSELETIEKRCVISMDLFTTFETIPAQGNYVFNTTCKGKLCSLEMLISEPSGELFGCKNGADLVLCRSFGLFNIDWDDSGEKNYWSRALICEEHFEELYQSYFAKKTKYWHRHIRVKTLGGKQNITCYWPNGVPQPHLGTPHSWRYQVMKEESKILLENANFRIPVGSHICRQHKLFINRMRTNKKSSACRNNFCDKFEGTTDVPLNKTYSEESNIEKNSNSSFKKAIRDVGKSIGLQRLTTERNFDEWSARTKRDKVLVAKKLIDQIFTSLAPGHEKEFQKLVLSQEKNNFWDIDEKSATFNLMTQLVAQYNSAKTKSTRLHYLSIIANSLSFGQIQQFIPGLTAFYYRKAKILSRKPKEDIILTRKLERYDPERLRDFVNFITQPTIMISLPFGSITTRLSNSKRVRIPQTIRQSSAVQIIEMYKKKLIDEDKVSLLMSDSTMFQILNVCAATPRRAHQCVDYFVANGDEAFDKLETIINAWLSDNYIDANYHAKLVFLLKETRQYVYTDYRLHGKVFSRVADHCFTFSLSDPENSNFSSSCSAGAYPHVHDMLCERCEKGKLLFEEIRDFTLDRLNETKLLLKFSDEPGNQSDKEVVERWEICFSEVSKSIRKIEELKMHFVRASHAAITRTEIIDRLSPEEALITMDFGQKYLPRWHRERQTDYYAYYHCAPTIATLAHLSERTGVFVSRFSQFRYQNKREFFRYAFSEAQAGKSSSDRMARIVKHYCGKYVDNGGNIRNCAEMFDALTRDRLIDGASIFHVTFGDMSRSDAYVKDISSFSDFTYGPDGSIQLLRFDKIGRGTAFNGKLFEPNRVVVHYVREGGYLASKVINVDQELYDAKNNSQTQFWYVGSKMKKDKHKKNNSQMFVKENEKEIEDENIFENDDSVEFSPPEIGKLFSCNEIGCISEFLTLNGLENHILRGKHVTRPERMTARDRSLKMFLQVLEEIEQTNPIIALEAAMKTEDVCSVNSGIKQKMGWALRVKEKTRPFTIDQKKFIQEQYDAAKQNKKRPDPHDAERKMQQSRKSDGSKRFNYEEYLDWRQIWNSFARIYKNDNESKKETTTSSVESEIDAESLKEPIFTDETMEIYESVEKELDNIFRRK